MYFINVLLEKGTNGERVVYLNSQHILKVEAKGKGAKLTFTGDNTFSVIESNLDIIDALTNNRELILTQILSKTGLGVKALSGVKQQM
jgi:hypothetical protein